jgi:carbonic anhydrase
VRAAGIPETTLRTLSRAGIDLNAWLTGFASPAEGVANSVQLIREHPLLPRKTQVHGLIINPETGKTDLLKRTKQSDLFT